MTLMPKNTETGKKKEKDVVRWLKNHGWEILYEGGRGPADIEAKRGSTKWFIQVKYTRSREISFARFDKERKDLIKLAENPMQLQCFALWSETLFGLILPRLAKNWQEGFCETD